MPKLSTVLNWEKVTIWDRDIKKKIKYITRTVPSVPKSERKGPSLACGKEKFKNVQKSRT